MHHRAEIAVIIPTHQRRDLLMNTLRSLALQTIAPERYQIVVVCDGCTDDTARFVSRAARPGGALDGVRIQVLEQPRSGAALARNRGVVASSAPLLLFLDDDMIAARNLLETHLALHAARPGGIVLGAILVHPDSPRSFLTRGLERWSQRRHAPASKTGEPVPITEVLTGHLSVARADFDVLGGFDTRFTEHGSFGGEDVEFGWRARIHRVPIVLEPDAVAEQVYTKNFLSLSRDIRQSAAADVLMTKKHPDIEPLLPLGRLDAFSMWQSRALRLTLKHVWSSRLVFAPLVLALEAAVRLRLTSPILERAHGVCRAHLYARGMLEGAGGRSPGRERRNGRAQPTGSGAGRALSTREARTRVKTPY